MCSLWFCFSPYNRSGADGEVYLITTSICMRFQALKGAKIGNNITTHGTQYYAFIFSQVLDTHFESSRRDGWWMIFPRPLTQGMQQMFSVNCRPRFSILKICYIMYCSAWIIKNGFHHVLKNYHLAALCLLTSLIAKAL